LNQYNLLIFQYSHFLENANGLIEMVATALPISSVESTSDRPQWSLLGWGGLVGVGLLLVNFLSCFGVHLRVAFGMLERYEGKLSRTVLRRELKSS